MARCIEPVKFSNSMCPMKPVPLCTSCMSLCVARCLLDSDDEVRDRALLYLEVLKQKQKVLSSAYILNSKYMYYLVGEGRRRQQGGRRGKAKQGGEGRKTKQEGEGREEVRGRGVHETLAWLVLT